MKYRNLLSTLDISHLFFYVSHLLLFLKSFFSDIKFFPFTNE